MKYLISLIFLLSLLGVFGRGEVYKGYPVYFYEPLLAVVFLYKIKQTLDSKAKRVLFFSLAIFIGYLLLITFLNSWEALNLKGYMYILRLGFYLFGFLAFEELFKEKTVRKFVNRYLKIFFFLFAFVNLLQYLFFRDLQVFKYIGFDPHFGRLVGPFLDPFLTASLLGIMAFLTARLKQIKFSFLFFLLLLLTNSRAGILSFAISFFLVKEYRKFVLKFRKVFVLIPFLILFVFLLNPGIAGNPLRTATVVSRLEDYKKGFSLIKENPVFGVGYNRLLEFRDKKKNVFKYSVGPYTPQGSFHSPYLTVLAVGGIVGFLLYLNFLWKVFQLFPFSEFFLFVCIFSFFDNVLLHPLVLLYLSAGVALLRSSGNS